MSRYYLVRFGAMGGLGTFRAVEAVRFPREARVVLRSRRGLEVGEVLADSEPPEHPAGDGELLRRVSVQDDLLLARLEKNRRSAIEACSRMLAERNLPAVLIDAELLFDGQSLYFYFLGEVTPEIERVTAELAELYEARVRFRRFTETLAAGCGPQCGTAEATGCGTSCSGCAVAAACKA